MELGRRDTERLQDGDELRFEVLDLVRILGQVADQGGDLRCRGADEERSQAEHHNEAEDVCHGDRQASWQPALQHGHQRGEREGRDAAQQQRQDGFGDVAQQPAPEQEDGQPGQHDQRNVERALPGIGHGGPAPLIGRLAGASITRRGGGRLHTLGCHVSAYHQLTFSPSWHGPCSSTIVGTACRCSRTDRDIPHRQL